MGAFIRFNVALILSTNHCSWVHGPQNECLPSCFNRWIWELHISSLAIRDFSGRQNSSCLRSYNAKQGSTSPAAKSLVYNQLDKHNVNSLLFYMMEQWMYVIKPLWVPENNYEMHRNNQAELKNRRVNYTLNNVIKNSLEWEMHLSLKSI